MKIIGFNRFYLYDNHKSAIGSRYLRNLQNDFKYNETNQYGVNFKKAVNMTDDEINHIMDQIKEKYQGKWNDPFLIYK